MTVVAVVLAGGSGSRMGQPIPKQYLPLAGKPVLAHTLQAFESCSAVDEVVLVVPPAWLSESREIAQSAAPCKLRAVIPGGETRQESSRLGLAALGDCPDDTVVLVHDAVRPFVTAAIVEECARAAAEHGAADVVVPADDTIVQGRAGCVETIPDRNLMYRGQTPQGFRLGILRHAHELACANGLAGATDDVRLVLAAGYPVRLVQGDYGNFKLTRPEDLLMAELMMSQRRLKSAE